MEILKAATEWAKAEVFSTRFFILAGIAFISIALGFWQLGKTELARAYIIPFSVAGALLLTIGVGLFYTNKARIVSFAEQHKQDASAFLASEMTRTESTLKEYSIVLKVVPMLVIAAALVLIFVNTPAWRAIAIATIAMLVVILLIDGMAHARIEAYHKQLTAVEK